MRPKKSFGIQQGISFDRNMMLAAFLPVEEGFGQTCLKLSPVSHWPGISRKMAKTTKVNGARVNKMARIAINPTGKGLWVTHIWKNW